MFGNPRPRIPVPRSLIVAGVGCGIFLLPFGFQLGSWSTRRHVEEQIAASDARLAALREEMAMSVLQMRQAHISQTVVTEEIKRQLQSEMGLLSVDLLRQRSDSFVQLHTRNGEGQLSYGTAGYLGNGYFITVKHGVTPLVADPEADGEPSPTITIRYGDEDLEARVIDSGDARVEVDPGDWAIIKVEKRIDLPALSLNLDYAYRFADPIFRLGNDYSKGILLSTGYVGRRTPNGLVTCLTDGHPGASGGGVLDQEGNLVGIPVGRMAGDYRFSFILPLRAEMFTKVPDFQPGVVATTGAHQSN
jgi:hypothetical protein